MAHPNPVQLELYFARTVRQIDTASSERVQLELIVTFLGEVKGYERETASYLVQLFEKLPEFKSPLLYAGIHPHLFKAKIEQLEQTAHILDIEENMQMVLLKIESYKTALAYLNTWVGEYTWHETPNNNLVKATSKKEQRSYTEGILIPVIEQSNEIQSGRLRRLKVEIIGVSKNDFELKPTFGVLGADAGAFLTEVEQAAGSLLKESRNGKNKIWKATAIFELNHAWHAGRSANLALSGAFYCEMLRAEEQPDYFKVNPAVCITGEIDSAGNVLPVDEQSISLKVEAAFFSWVHVLVVPANQLSNAINHIEKLQLQFPNRHLPVVGVAHLRELFFDRRITLHHKSGIISHSLKKAWKKRFSVASILMFMVLIGIIGSLVYGPIDKNPTIFEYEGTEIVLKNKSGFELNRIQIDEYNIGNATKSVPGVKFDIIKLFDQDGDGLNEVLLNLTKSKESQDGILLLLSTDLKDTLWVNELDFPIEYKKHSYAYTVQHRGRKMVVEDLDGDGKAEIILSTEQHSYFQGHLNIISSSDGKLKQSYKGAGWFSIIEVYDFDEDGTVDILVCGEFKGFLMIGCSLLNTQNIEGFTPLGDRYWDDEKPRAIEKALFLWPRTIVGTTYNNMYGNSSATHVYASSVNPSTKMISLIHLDASIKKRLTTSSVNVLLTFDFNMNLVSVASSDTYDNLAKSLYDEGSLPFLADANYLETFKDSLIYWNGTVFQSKPTLNKKYLELVGEDSTYYKEFYFKGES